MDFVKKIDTTLFLYFKHPFDLCIQLNFSFELLVHDSDHDSHDFCGGKNEEKNLICLFA